MSSRFDRNAIAIKPLAERVNKLRVERDTVDPDTCGISLSPAAEEDVRRAASEAKAARARGAPVVLAFGAHSIKNGLSKTLIRLMKAGWVTHFATNGAGIIHDWEFAFQGMTGEDVRRYASEGQFGIWEETGLYLNLAIAIGAWRGLGYGESVGAMIRDQGLNLPTRESLRADILAGASAATSTCTSTALDKAAAAADLLALFDDLTRSGHIPVGRATTGDTRDDAGGVGIGKTYREGFLSISHPFAAYSLGAAAFQDGIPFTAHPMFGHDIIYTHPANRGAAIGRSAERDFLSFVDSISRLEGGVYLSVGSAVMSPMIFEKALSMARNVARQKGNRIEDFSIHVVDLAESAWDWMRDGEPPQDNPAYYLRFCKTFARMGGRMTYASADNRAWLSAFARELRA